MIPGWLLPIAAEAVTGAVKKKFADSGKDGEGGIVEDALESLFTHEKSKASIRPLMMRLTGFTSILVAVAGVVAALAPIIPGWNVEQETSDAVVTNLLYLFGATGGGYVTMHGTRAAEKMSGKA